jgi:thiol-disulfide isomerase/thioredoxin
MNAFLLALLFVLLGILVFRFWKPFVSPPKRDVKPNEANLYFFYTNWCGFSQKAMPEWSKLEASLGSDGYFGKTHVKLHQVDCEKDKARCTLYGVNAYPTVILETKQGLVDFEKRPTAESLRGFLREQLGKERESL